MAYLVLAYPEIKKEDYNLIQEFRRQNDNLYFSVVDPHFTIVFPVFDTEENNFITEVVNKSKDCKSFNFEIKCTTVNKDSFSDYFHLLMVPDKGYSDIVKLHDKLYSDKLFKELRLDIDFIPHIAIANSQDKLVVKKWADEWNKKDFSIQGKVNKLTIVDYTENKVNDLKVILLKE
ncbi:MAG: hypothetical protein Kow0068_13570 [Marinilabiliales bacterium]